MTLALFGSVASLSVQSHSNPERSLDEETADGVCPLIDECKKAWTIGDDGAYVTICNRCSLYKTDPNRNLAFQREILDYH